MPASGYKLFATGDVLTAADVNNYLMLQTVMVFASSAARTTALSGVLAEGLVSYLKDTDVVEVYTGAAWVSLDDPNAVQNSGYYAAGKNAIINSAFNVWQRGTSISVSASTTPYTADRWQVYTNANQATTVSRQATSDTTNLPFIQYAMRYQRNSGQTGTTTQSAAQTLDSATSIPFAGKTIALSFYARAGANYSPASSALIPRIQTGTGSDQNFYTGFTGSVLTSLTAATLTTTWQRFSYSQAIPSTATQIGFDFTMTPVGTAGTNDYFEITGVQLEIGSTATAFQTASGTIGGELALCQRYYQRFTSEGTYGLMGQGIGYNTGVLDSFVYFPVKMRIVPSAIDTSTMATFFCEASAGVSMNTPTSITLGTITSSSSIGGFSVNKAASFTASVPYKVLANNSTSAFIGWSAEL